MSNRKISQTWASVTTRRQLITGGTFAVAGVVLSSTRAGARQAASEPHSTGADKLRTSLHQEMDFKASPHRIYEILLDSKQFAACTGQPADINREAGGTFSLFAGVIVGRNIELVEDKRIVQAWRPNYWVPGDYSLVEFQLKGDESQTKVILDHKAFPEGDFVSLGSGWKSHYWKPLTKLFS